MRRRLPVRNTDPVTSWAAAYDALGSAHKLKPIVLAALREFGPMTHDELIELVNRVRPASPSGVRTRVSELVAEGLVEQVPGMIARSEYGRPSLLWRAVP